MRWTCAPPTTSPTFPPGGFDFEENARFASCSYVHSLFFLWIDAALLHKGIFTRSKRGVMIQHPFPARLIAVMACRCALRPSGFSPNAPWLTLIKYTHPCHSSLPRHTRPLTPLMSKTPRSKYISVYSYLFPLRSGTRPCRCGWCRRRCGPVGRRRARP